MAIIAISGYSNSGKDTIGKIIQYLQCPPMGNISVEDVVTNYDEHQWWLEEQSEWEIKKFAGKLKDIASHLTGIDIENFEDQEFKKTILGPEWGTVEDNPLNAVPGFENVRFNRLMTVREFLQKLGTDALRNGLHPNVWVNALFADYNCVPADRAPGGWDCDNWIITDCRFTNEAEVIKAKGGIIIRVDRPGYSPVNNHPSETELDTWMFDYKLVNNSDLFDLKESVKNILIHAKYL